MTNPLCGVARIIIDHSGAMIIGWCTSNGQRHVTEDCLLPMIVEHLDLEGLAKKGVEIRDGRKREDVWAIGTAEYPVFVDAPRAINPRG